MSWIAIPYQNKADYVGRHHKDVFDRHPVSLYACANVFVCVDVVVREWRHRAPA